MATAAAHKYLEKCFSNEVKLARLTYNFANDAGAQSTINLATCLDKIKVIDAVVHVETACTSGGSATVKIGITGGTTDAFLDVTSGAVASLADDYTVRETAGQNKVIAANGVIAAVIATADLTAGKINLVLRYVNAV